MAYRIVLLPLALRRLDGIYEWGEYRIQENVQHKDLSIESFKR